MKSTEIAGQERTGRSRAGRRPSAVEEIRKSAKSFRQSVLELEKTARISDNEDERLRAVSEIARRAKALGPKIGMAVKELKKAGEDREFRLSRYRQLMVAKLGEYKAKAEVAKAEAGKSEMDEPGEKLAGLEDGRDACYFALERLVSSSDSEVRNRAFDGLKDNPVAVKLTCLDSPYPDIRKRARELLSSPNAHFTNYVPKGDDNYLELPEFFRASKGT